MTVQGLLMLPFSVKKYGRYLAFMLILTVFACDREDVASPESKGEKAFKVAVVLPYGDGLQEEWHRTIEWALENLNKALATECGMGITAEWYDEDNCDIHELFGSLAIDEDVYAIIGPLYSEDANTAASICARTGKTLIPALATSEQMMRAYSGKEFLWCLAENDISQCELLLALAKKDGAETVSLLSSDDLYGQTFTDWFAFQTKEMGLEFVDAKEYGEYDIEEKMENLIDEGVDCLVCVANGNDATRRMNNVRKEYAEAHTKVIFSDGAYLLPPDVSYDGMEGVVQTFDPSTKFENLYIDKFWKIPPYGSAHFYDAVMLSGLAIMLVGNSGYENVNDALTHIVDLEGESINICDDAGLAQAVKALRNGGGIHITGASGELRFLQKQHTNVLHSIYGHWTISEGKHCFTEYFTSGNESSNANWEWLPTKMQTFGEDDIAYPKQDGLHVLIVAGSAGWENYRHQANAQAIYNALLENGVKTSDIAMVAEADITGGIDGLLADYHPSEIDWGDVADDVLFNDGKFKMDSTVNLLIYWAGHGEKEGLKWLDKTISPTEITETFSNMARQKRFRKALVLIEACYSGKVGKALEGIPGLLCVTAANENETSKASKYSATLSAWTSNCFTDALLDIVANPENVSTYEMYTETYARTIGSHVSVYNADSFGNLRHSMVTEFFTCP